MVWVAPTTRARAFWLRTNPSSATADSTRSRVAAFTRCGWFSTFDTVLSDTPATRATSCTVGGASCSAARIGEGESGKGES